MTDLRYLILNCGEQGFRQAEASEFDWGSLSIFKDRFKVLVRLLVDLQLGKKRVLNVAILAQLVKNGLSLQVLEGGWNEEALADFAAYFISFNQLLNRTLKLVLICFDALSQGI